MQSLADYLGTRDAPPDRQAADQPLAPPENLSGSDFANAVLNSYEFRQYIVYGLTLGSLPQSIVLRLMDYADGWGKPADKLEIDDRREVISSLSKEELKERIAFLQDLVQELPDDQEVTVVH